MTKTLTRRKASWRARLLCLTPRLEIYRLPNVAAATASVAALNEAREVIATAAGHIFAYAFP